MLLRLKLKKQIEVWCSGNTTGFGPVIRGSNPCTSTKIILMGKLRLGDKVETIIKTVVPKFHKKKKGCASCAKRKAKLNKI